jgi:type IV secretion system protein VirB2
MALWLAVGLLGAIEPAFAQTSPFSTGATSLQTNFLAIFTPIAVIAVMGIAIAFWFNRISAAWAAGLVVGIVMFFGAPQMVTWVRGMFAV